MAQKLFSRHKSQGLSGYLWGVAVFRLLPGLVSNGLVQEAYSRSEVILTVDLLCGTLSARAWTAFLEQYSRLVLSCNLAVAVWILARCEVRVPFEPGHC